MTEIIGIARWTIITHWYIYIYISNIHIATNKAHINMDSRFYNSRKNVIQKTALASIVSGMVDLAKSNTSTRSRSTTNSALD